MLKVGILRNFVFGVEDSLVSTLGFITGIASASVERHTVLLSGAVLIFVEAFSMGISAFLSEESALEARYRRSIRPGKSILDGLVMFVSYLGAGCIVIAPYTFGPPDESVARSIIVTLVALFVLGIFVARIAELPIVRRGLRMAIIGGCTALLGILVASFIEGFK